MKRFSAGLVLMLLCTFSIFAQNKVITVSGRVVESDTKEPAAQATVQLLFRTWRKSLSLDIHVFSWLINLSK